MKLKKELREMGLELLDQGLEEEEIIEDIRKSFYRIIKHWMVGYSAQSRHKKKFLVEVTDAKRFLDSLNGSVKEIGAPDEFLEDYVFSFGVGKEIGLSLKLEAVGGQRKKARLLLEHPEKFGKRGKEIAMQRLFDEDIIKMEASKKMREIVSYIRPLLKENGNEAMKMINGIVFEGDEEFKKYEANERKKRMEQKARAELNAKKVK